MKKIILLLVATFLFADTVFSFESGRLKVFVFIDGKPIQNTEVILQNVGKKMTDGDGLALFITAPREYTLRLKSEAFPQINSYEVKTKVMADEETQLIIDFKKGAKTANVLEDIAKFQALDAKSPEEIEAEKNLKKGTLVGTILNTEDKSPIVGARVFVKGSPLEAITDDKGVFKLELLEGKRAISVIHNDYSTRTIEGIEILPEAEVTKEITMTPAGVEMDEFVVLAPHIEGGVAALVDEKKNATSIADILGSEQMSNKGDSNAAAALKRVAGITIVDGKFVYVRGLGERYSNVELNGLALPSPDPIKRVVPLDLFPASIIGSLKVQKSFSPDVPASFGGGYIDIRTKANTTSDYFKASFGVSAHSSVFDGTQGNFYKGGNLDFLGIDDGTRSIPSQIINAIKIQDNQKVPRLEVLFTNADGQYVFSEQTLYDYTKALVQNRSLNTTQSNIPLGGNISIDFAKTITLSEISSLSIATNYAYSTSSNYLKNNYYSYDMDDFGVIDTQNPDTGYYELTSTQYVQSGMVNLGYKYGDNFKTKYTGLILLNTQNKTRKADGILGSNDFHLEINNLDWQQRLLALNQITGEYSYHIGTDMKFIYGLEYGYAGMSQPANVQYSYLYLDNGTKQIQTTSVQNFLFENINTDDNVFNISLQNQINFDFVSEKDLITFGYNWLGKYRTTRVHKLYLNATSSFDSSTQSSAADTILQSNILNSTSYSGLGYIAQTIFSPSDYYDGVLNGNDLFIKVDSDPWDILHLSLGVRKVYLEQKMYEYGYNTSDLTLIDILEHSLIVDNYYPSFDMKLQISDDDQLRFGVSQSYIYPDFREFSNAGFSHPSEAASVVGNKNLTNTDITSYDLKYEHYFSPTESISTSLYYKYLDNPIEDTQLPSTSLPVYSFMNSDFAHLSGVEFDYYKSFDFIHEALENLYFSTNYSYTYSNVELKGDDLDKYTSNNRPLQGLSQHVFNASISYDDSEIRTITLSYNKMSERIRKIGMRDGVRKYLDQYEYPPHILDFVWKEKFDADIELKFSIKNILNTEILRKEGENITREYKTGQSYSIALSMKY